MHRRLSARHLDTLLVLGWKCSMFGTVSVSTVALAKELGLSQQTVSRNLIEMEKDGLIVRDQSMKGLDIRITKEGYLSLRTIRMRIDGILSKSALEMDGRVVSGLGEGGYYVGMKGYQEQFRQVLGFAPFPGTLNLEIEPDLQERFLWDLEPASLEGFTSGGRTFGKIDIYPVILRMGGKELESAIIVPQRTTHPKGICEVVAKENLRERYRLKDGSIIIIAKVGV